VVEKIVERDDVTDLGYMPELVKVHLHGADCLVLESNRDLDMLKVGPYPWTVQQRTLSSTGHLSNHAISEHLSDADGFDAPARCFILAHLSEENNNSDLARLSAGVPRIPSLRLNFWLPRRAFQ